MGSLFQKLDPMSYMGHYTLLGRTDPVFNKSQLGNVPHPPTPYGGVTPTLAAANAGYTAGGPGAVNPLAATGNAAEAIGARPSTPALPGVAAQNPYAAAAQGVTKQVGVPNRAWGQ